MTTQHTPGPWTTSSLPNGTEWTVSIDDGDMLADLTGCPNEQANARLIAAAPELLAALEWWIAQMQNDSCDDMGKLLDDMTDKARAVIAKATGSST